MNEQLNQDQAQLADLKQQGKALSSLLREISSRLSENGEAAADESIQELNVFRAGFIELRNRVHASEARQPTTPLYESLNEIEEVLNSRSFVNRAIEILDHLDAVRPLDPRDIATWKRCSSEAQAFRHELLSVPMAQAQVMATQVLSLEHPLGVLEKLVYEGDSLPDEQWWTLQQTVASNYGRDLTTAIMRRRLSVHSVGEQSRTISAVL